MNAPFCGWDFHVPRDAEWNDPLPQFLDADDNIIHFTGRTLQLFVRASFDFATPLMFLTSAGSAGITINDAAAGLATVYRTQAQVEAGLPAGEFRWFLRLVDGAQYEELGRGPIYIHPGEDSTS